MEILALKMRASRTVHMDDEDARKENRKLMLKEVIMTVKGSKKYRHSS